MQLQFAEFVFDSEARVLCRNDGVVPLTPKAFQLLELLLRERPKAVARTRILAELWPGTFVTEANVTNLVSEVRDALADHRDSPRFVRTLHGFGYAFCGTTSAAPPVDLEVASPGGFRLLGSAQEFVLSPGITVVGRGRECAARMESVTVSRRHARLLLADGLVTIEDLGSKNGTFVAGERVQASRLLADGDEVRFGSVRMTLKASVDSTTTQGLPLRRRRRP